MAIPPIGKSLASAVCGLLLFNAQDGIAGDDLFKSYHWQNRLLLLFAPGESDPRYRLQQDILAQLGPELEERDLIVIETQPEKPVTIDGEQQLDITSQKLYGQFSVDPASFRVILIGKDGTVKLNLDRAATASKLFDLIDSMPMRQWEMQQPDS